MTDMNLAGRTALVTGASRGIGRGIALAIIPLLARVGNAEVGTDAVTALWQLFATAGFAGGFVYWLIAGRNA